MFDPRSSASESRKSRPERLFLVNAGNTHTSMAVWAGGRLRGLSRHPTRLVKVGVARDILKRVRGAGALDAVVVAAVVPAALDRWRRAAQGCAVPLLAVDGRLDPGVPVRIRPRSRIGADRMANVAAAVARWGSPVIVVDLGTAATFDAVTAEDGFAGGVIAPGPAMLNHALASGTAQLPKIDWPTGRLPVAGRSTVSAIGIGLRVGYAGLVSGILAHFRRSPRLAQAPVCLTGGAARRIARDLATPFPVIPRLTLEGLIRLYELNPIK